MWHKCFLFPLDYQVNGLLGKLWYILCYIWGLRKHLSVFEDPLLEEGTSDLLFFLSIHMVTSFLPFYRTDLYMYTVFSSCWSSTVPDIFLHLAVHHTCNCAPVAVKRCVFSDVDFTPALYRRYPSKLIVLAMQNLLYWRGLRSGIPLIIARSTKPV